MRSPLSLIGSVLFACAVPHTPLCAQQLVADLMPQGVSVLGSSPTQFLALGPRTVFLASTTDSGGEPWATDGTAAGTYRICELVPGTESATSVRICCEYQGKALFTAKRPGNGVGLFLTDGTPGNLTELGSLGLPGSTGNAPNIQNVVALGNGALLVTHGSVGTTTTYATDLTVAGTRLLPGLVNFVPELTIGNVTYGSAVGSPGGYEIWATDGTPAGTRRVATGFTGDRPQHFTAWNGRIWFQEFQSQAGWLSSTDGQQGYVRHALFGSYVIASASGPMFVVGNRLVTLIWGLMWSTDGTSAGTGSVQNMPCIHLRDLIAYGGNLYFAAENTPLGNELWTTDGTAAGTTLVADLVPGVNGSHPDQMLVTPNGLYYSAVTPQGLSLMRLTGASTLQNLGPLPDGAPRLPTSPSTGQYLDSGLVAFQGGVLFSAAAPAGNDEPWFASPTQAPAQVADINRGLASFGPAQPTPVGDRLFFLALGPTQGYEPWSTDGTAAGTLAHETIPGTATEVNGSTSNLVTFGDRVAVATTRRLLLTDGTPAGTVTLRGGSPAEYCTLAKVAGDRLYFLGTSGLYQSDGTVAGTLPIPAANVPLLTDYDVLPTHLVLRSYDTNYPYLYGTDGTSAPVLLAPDAVMRLGSVGGRVVFQESLSTTDLKATDGTLAGTTTILAAAAFTHGAVVQGDRMYFLIGTTIWRTDGTAAGTAAVAPLPSGMADGELLPTANGLFVLGATPVTGRELWQLDGATNQVQLVVDLAPGSRSGVARAWVAGTGDTLFFAGGDEPFGVEPYVTDGTVAGTRMLGDVNPGPGSSNPKWLGIADATAYFLAYEDVHGGELWSIPVAALGAANVQPLGLPCAGSAGLPHLAATAVPSPGAATFGYRLTASRGLTLTLLALGTDDAAVDLGGCELRLGGAIATRLGSASLSGTTTFGVPLPAHPLLLGYRFVAQGFALDPLVARGFSASPGAITVIGR